MVFHYHFPMYWGIPISWYRASLKISPGAVEGVSGVFIWWLAKESLGEWRSATSAPSSFSMAIGRE